MVSSTIVFDFLLSCTNIIVTITPYSQEQLCGLVRQHSAPVGSRKTSYSTKIVISFSAPSLDDYLTQFSTETSSCSETITDMVETSDVVVESTASNASGATCEPLKQSVATVEDSDSFIDSTETTTCFSVPSEPTPLTQLPNVYITSTIPSHLSSRSVQEQAHLKTIVEEEETDFSEESSQPLPTFTKVSLIIPREQEAKIFEVNELTKIVSSFAFPREETSAMNNGNSESLKLPVETIQSTSETSDSTEIFAGFSASSLNKDATALTQSSIETAFSTETMTAPMKQPAAIATSIAPLKLPVVIAVEGADNVTDLTGQSTSAPLLTAGLTINTSTVVHLGIESTSNAEAKDTAEMKQSTNASAEDTETLGLLPVKRPLSLQPGSHKEKLIILECACECEWCEGLVQGTKVSTCTHHGVSSKSRPKRHTGTRKKRVNNFSGQAGQNKKTKQAASPSPRPTTKNTVEPNRRSDEFPHPLRTSRSLFLPPNQQGVKTYAGAIKSTKTESSLPKTTRAQTTSTGPTSNEHKLNRHANTTKSAKTKSSVSDSLQAQRLRPIATSNNQKLKNYAGAAKTESSPSRNFRAQGPNSGKGNSKGTKGNKGRGKKNWTETNQCQTVTTKRSSNKKWNSRPQGRIAERDTKSAVDISTRVSGPTSSTWPAISKTSSSLDTASKSHTHTQSDSSLTSSYSWRLKHGGDKGGSASVRTL